MRDVLKQNCGIDLDFAINGVCLPTNQNTKRGRTVTHDETFDPKYYDKVNDMVTTAYSSGGCNAVKNTLKNIRLDLIDGTRFWLP